MTIRDADEPARPAAKRAAMPPELAAVLAAAFAIRLGVFYFVPNVHWPDEVFQVLEPAHRLVFGTGAVSWEWVLGIRSWLLPGFMAGLMELGRYFGNQPNLINLPIEIFMAAAGTAPAAVAYLWGRRHQGRAGGLVAAAVVASWIDLVYMSGHTLDGVVAADVLAVALYLGLPGDGTRLSRQRLWLVGGVLGLTFVLRFQLGPALLVAAAGICGWRGSGKRWLALIAGASIPVLVLGLLDWATLGVPFKSIFINVWVNLALGVSAEAGKEPFYTYLVLPLDIWGPVGFVAVIGTAVVGARRLPLLAAVAIAMIAVLSFIPHKEYRFIYPAIVLVIILSGVGTSDLIALLRDAIPRLKAATPALVGAAILLWCGLSYSIARSAIFSIPWTRERAQIEAFRNVADHRGACGLGLLGVRWTVTPGMSWLPPQVPLVQLRPATFDADARAVDYVLARARFRRLTGYERTRCFAGDTDASGDAHMRLCLWHRAGGCTTKVAALPVNWPGVLVKDWHRAPPPWDEQAAVPR